MFSPPVFAGGKNSNKESMKKYEIPLIEVANIEAMSMLMNSPSDDLEGNPKGGMNNPEMAPKRKVF